MKKLISFVCSFAMVIAAANAQTAHVYFDYGKHELTTGTRKTLDSLMATLSAAPEKYQVQLIGHTDSDGNKTYNQELSEKRCNAVRGYLSDKGWAKAAFSIEGRNYTDSISTNRSEQGKARNRRVEVVFSLLGDKHHTLHISKKTPTPPVVNQRPNLGIDIPKETQTFSADKGVTVHYKSGTVITIPADVLMYANGSSVTGDVQIEYYEMRDAADFIAAGIPMEFKGSIFNSAGMFEINVSQNGQPLYVKPNKYYDIEFAKTQELPNVGFFKYDRSSNEWTTLGSLDDKSESFSTDTKEPCFSPNNGFKITAKDTVNTFMVSIEMGLEMAKNGGLIKEYAAGRFLTLEERWESPNYAGTTVLNKDQKWYKTDMMLEISAALDKSKWMYADEAETKIVAQNHTYLDIKTVSNQFPDLAVLNSQSWIYIRKGEEYSIDELRETWSDGAKINVVNGREIISGTDSLASSIVDSEGYLFSQKRRWTDARLEYAGDGAFTLVVKGEKYRRFTIYPEAAFGDKQRDKICKDIYAQYQAAFAKRQQAFDEKVTEHKAHWDYFLSYSKPFRKGSERCMSKSDWINYFDKNHGETMAPRYRTLALTPENADTIALYLNTGNMPLPMADPGTALGQGLRLNGFGVFNCDQITRLGNAVEIIADYQTTDGKKISPTMLYLIDYRINSALSFDPYQFSLNPQSQSAVFVADEFGRSYLVKSETIAALRVKDQGQYLLTAEPLSDKVKNTDDLRRELGLATK